MQKIWSKLILFPAFVSAFQPRTWNGLQKGNECWNISIKQLLVHIFLQMDTEYKCPLYG